MSQLASQPDTSEPVDRTGRLAQTIQVIALICGGLLACWVLSGILPTIFLAILVAIMLRGTSDSLARRTGAPPTLMLAVVSLLFIAALLGFFLYLGPQVAEQSQRIWKQLFQTISTLRQSYDQTRIGHLILDQLQQAVSGLEKNVSGYATAVAATTLNTLTEAFLVIVTGLYLAISPGLYRRGLVMLFPLRYRSRADAVLLDLGGTLRWWLLGQLIDMVVVGVLSFIGLWILGVPVASALAGLAGLLTFIPYLGAVAAAIPATLVALTVSGPTALWTLLVFVICHMAEGYVVSPLVQRRTIHMPPAVSILSMTVFGSLFGMLGVVLGTPVAAVVLTVAREVYVSEILKDPEVEGPTG